MRVHLDIEEQAFKLQHVFKQKERSASAPVKLKSGTYKY